MRHRLFVFGLWLGGTFAAMILASMAVQLASAKVTDRPAAVVSARQIESELQSSSPTTSLDAEAGVPAGGTRVPTSAGAPTSLDATTTLPPGAAAPSTTAVGPRGVPTTTGPGSATTIRTTTDDDRPSTPPTTRDDHGGTPGGPGPTNLPTTIDDSNHSGGGPNHDGPTTTTPATTTTTAPASVSTAQYVMTGGWVKVRCEGSTATLVTATPNPGYQLAIKDEHSDPSRVEVRFTGASHTSDIRVTCTNGVLDPQQQENGG